MPNSYCYYIISYWKLKGRVPHLPGVTSLPAACLTAVRVGRFRPDWWARGGWREVRLRKISFF